MLPQPYETQSFNIFYHSILWPISTPIFRILLMPVNPHLHHTHCNIAIQRTQWSNKCFIPNIALTSMQSTDSSNLFQTSLFRIYIRCGIVSSFHYMYNLRCAHSVHCFNCVQLLFCLCYICTNKLWQQWKIHKSVISN